MAEGTVAKSEVPAGHWRTKDGRNILISELEDQHLLSILKLLQKNADYNRALMVAEHFQYTGPQSDMAREAFDEEFDRLLAQTWRDFVKPPYQQLEAEALRRGLELPQPFSALLFETKLIKRILDAISKREVPNAVGRNG